MTGGTPQTRAIPVQLSERDGNAFAIIGRVWRALREADIPGEDIERFTQEARASTSYDALLQLVFAWVDVQ